MMKMFSTLLLVLAATPCFAQSTVTVPWDEFSTLYRERLEQTLKPGEPQPEPVYTIEEAAYRLQVSDVGASGTVFLRGRVLQGRPPPLFLFTRDMAITGIDEMQGGTLLSDAEGYRLFTQGEGRFQLSFGVALAVNEDQRSRYLALSIPRAVKNTLELILPAGMELLESPGLPQGEGRYYFAPREELHLRLEDRSMTALPPAIDSFTRVQLQGNQYRYTSYFIPTHPVIKPLQIQLPGVRYLGSSLKPSWLKDEGNGQLDITLPRDWQEPFSVDYETDTTEAQLVLPQIVDNRGRQGEFQIQEPVEARITPQGDELQRDIPALRLPQALRGFAQVQNSYLHARGPVQLELVRFETVSTPEIVLDAIHFYTSYTENGSALAVLRLELPPEAGSRLQLKPIPGAEIWSLNVNNTPKSLYTHQAGSWIIPLDPGQVSVVELAYLQKGEKLALKGRVSLNMPATGLTARRVNVAVALAERVQLIALEGDLEPTQGAQWPKAQGFTGTPYYFTRPFYRGEALSAAIYYKELVEQRSGS